MVTLEQFKQNAIEKGICSLVSNWDNCRSKKQLIDLALDIRSIPYLANAIAEGWGISKDVIQSEFAPFLNGRYVRSKDGYTSSIYCGNTHQKDSIRISTTVALIIGFNGIITPPPICEIYLVDSSVRLKGDGGALIYLYNSNIISSDKCEVRIKENKKY